MFFFFFFLFFFFVFFFFFSSRRRHTRLVSDWSSDVCSSDLLGSNGASFAFPLRIFVLRSLSVANARFGGLITLTRVNLVFLLFAFLVHDAQRTSVGSDQFHLHFVEFPVFSAAGGREGNAVLVTEKSGNAAEDVGNFAVELREPRVSAGFLS